MEYRDVSLKMCFIAANWKLCQSNISKNIFFNSETFERRLRATLVMIIFLRFGLSTFKKAKNHLTRKFSQIKLHIYYDDLHVPGRYTSAQLFVLFIYLINLLFLLAMEGGRWF